MYQDCNRAKDAERSMLESLSRTLLQQIFSPSFTMHYDKLIPVIYNYQDIVACKLSV